MRRVAWMAVLVLAVLLMQGRAAWAETTLPEPPSVPITVDSGNM